MQLNEWVKECTWSNSEWNCKRRNASSEWTKEPMKEWIETTKEWRIKWTKKGIKSTTREKGPNSKQQSSSCSLLTSAHHKIFRVASQLVGRFLLHWWHWWHWWLLEYDVFHYIYCESDYQMDQNLIGFSERSFVILVYVQFPKLLANWNFLFITGNLSISQRFIQSGAELPSFYVNQRYCVLSLLVVNYLKFRKKWIE